MCRLADAADPFPSYHHYIQAAARWEEVYKEICRLGDKWPFQMFNTKDTSLPAVFWGRGAY